MPERPVECSECKKAQKVIYKEIADGKITAQKMCASCPVLLQKLQGITPRESEERLSESATTLHCGHCHTSLEAVKMGSPVGCAQCYTVFGDVLYAELIDGDKLPQAMGKARRNQPLHIGKTPKAPVTMLSSNRLTALNEALNEAIQKEHYEEAARLRDQINDLSREKDDPAP